MATWATHLMIADKLLESFPALDRRGFCVGNIAPDCNIENADWSEFTPPREVTHWMRGKTKCFDDCEAFRAEYLGRRRGMISSAENYAFLLGYYSHLLTDVAFQNMLRDEARVKSAWERIMSCPDLCEQSAGLEKNWDSLKKLVPKHARIRELEYLEALYLRDRPDSGYLTEILVLEDFPDYLDYLPHGCIARKVRLMTLPSPDPIRLVSISKEEFDSFADDTASLVADKLRQIAPFEECVSIV